MPQTLIEYAKGTQDPILSGIIETFARTSAIMDALPFKSISGNALAYNQESVLPGIGFRGINKAYSESVGVLLPLTEKIKIMGGDMDTDKALVKMYGPGRRATDIQMQAKAQALKFTKEFFDGDEATDPEGFNGVNKRITGAQIIQADGSGTAGAVLKKNHLLQMIDASDEKPDLLVWGKAFDRQVDNLYAGSNILSTDKNQWGQRIKMFDGIPVGIVDKDHLGNVVLDFDETVGTSSGICASAYAFKFGIDSAVCGLQNGAPEGVDLGEIDAKPVFRYRLEWLIGMAMFHPRCASRLVGVTKASGII
jgi:hypothetical protein